MSIEALAWLGIVFCVLQSGIFSGLNLALFRLSALDLEVQAAVGSRDAARVLTLRRDSNFLLTTILWGNVGTNVLLTLLSNSVLAGALGFGFSTFVITFGGEILPQAYFSRHALRMASLLSPVLRFYQLLLYPIAKPTARMLDAWLGPEGIQYMSEREIREALKKHIQTQESDIDSVEGTGALNFLALDDVLVRDEGEPVDPESVIRLPHEHGRPVFPEFERSPDDPFLKRVQASGKKWVLVASPDGSSVLALDADGFLRAALFDTGNADPRAWCHRPVMVRDLRTTLGDVLSKLEVEPEHAGDDVIDRDLVLMWADEKRLITGADILGRLLRGITRRRLTSQL